MKWIQKTTEEVCQAVLHALAISQDTPKNGPAVLSRYLAVISVATMLLVLSFRLPNIWATSTRTATQGVQPTNVDFIFKDPSPGRLTSHKHHSKDFNMDKNLPLLDSKGCRGVPSKND